MSEMFGPKKKEEGCHDSKKATLERDLGLRFSKGGVGFNTVTQMKKIRFVYGTT